MYIEWTKLVEIKIRKQLDATERFMTISCKTKLWIVVYRMKTTRLKIVVGNVRQIEIKKNINLKPMSYMSRKTY